MSGSRLCVKHIGKLTTETQLKDLFSSKGEVTDVKIVKTKTGKSREFAFIGFRSDEQATRARDYFHNSFIGTSKLTVEVAKKLETDNSALLATSGDVKSRHTKKKIEKIQKAREKEESESRKSIKEAKRQTAQHKQQTAGDLAGMDAEKAEFFQLVKNRANKGALWSNDTSLAPDAAASAKTAPSKRALKHAPSDSDSGSDSDESTEEDEDDVNDMTADQAPSSSDSAAKVKATSEPLSDMDFLRSKVSKTVDSDSDSDADDSDDSGDECDSDKEEEWDADAAASKRKSSKQKKSADVPAVAESMEIEDAQDKEKNAAAAAGAGAAAREEEEDDASESGRLFVRNIPFTCTEDDLRELFTPYGVVSELHIPINTHRGSTGGMGAMGGLGAAMGIGSLGGGGGAMGGDDANPENNRDLQLFMDSGADVGTSASGGSMTQQYNKGYAFVQYLFPECAVKALAALDGSSFQGRLLHIIHAQKKKAVAEQEEGKSGSKLSSYQKKLEADRKKLMNRVEGWNSAYVRSDTAVDALADSYGVRSGDILDASTKSAGDLAITMAVGEGQIISENKEFFGSVGIDMDTLESSHSSSKASKRSTNTLLVKNLRHNTSDRDELENMFAKYGALARFLMPPNRTVAYVEFIEATDARSAFKHLAYKRYHNMPLYLEWAPLHVKPADAPASSSTAAAAAQSSSNKGKAKGAAEEAGEQDDAADAAKTKQKEAAEETVQQALDYGTVFVKNLNFKTTTSDIQHHVTNVLKACKAADVRVVVIPTKTNSAGSSGGSNLQVLSMGYGFIELTSVALANTVISKLNNSVLDGHKLEAKLSEKRLQNTTAATSKKRAKSGAAAGDAQTAGKAEAAPSSKIVVRNLAFQTTLVELKKLCSVYGNIKSIRLPKKVINSNNSSLNQHRGFAFVEYNSKKEAEMAFNQLKNVHLYGRHLVCEYANDTDADEDDGTGVGGFSGNLSSNSNIAHKSGGKKELEALREKARKDMKVIEYSNYAASGAGASKKRRTMVEESAGGGGAAGLDNYSKGGSHTTFDDDDDRED